MQVGSPAWPVPFPGLLWGGCRVSWGRSGITSIPVLVAAVTVTRSQVSL